MSCASIDVPVPSTQYSSVLLQGCCSVPAAGGSPLSPPATAAARPAGGSSSLCTVLWCSVLYHCSVVSLLVSLLRLVPVFVSPLSPSSCSWHRTNSNIVLGNSALPTQASCNQQSSGPHIGRLTAEGVAGWQGGAPAPGRYCPVTLPVTGVVCYQLATFSQQTLQTDNAADQ